MPNFGGQPTGGPRAKRHHPTWVHIPNGPTFAYRACICSRCRRLTVADSYTMLESGQWMAICSEGHGWVVTPVEHAPDPNAGAAAPEGEA